MEEARGKHVAPSIDQLSFDCPHCQALARQFWFSVHADPLKADEKPSRQTSETLTALKVDDGDERERDRKLRWAERTASGRPLLEVHREFRSRNVQNVSISYCFSCNEIGLWVGDQLVWPVVVASPELKKLEILAELSGDKGTMIEPLNASPRGAAALLHLAVEKLCLELGVGTYEPRPALAPAIQEEVDARVQNVLDAVKIIQDSSPPIEQNGLRDDRATADALPGFVNLICEKLIIEPRHLRALYTKVREGAQHNMDQRS
jgi:hypothetical protein